MPKKKSEQPVIKRNLYIIAVGGTGVKCLESFIHLCAMGVVNNGKALDDKVIKIMVVDPDSSNGNLTRFSELLNSYNKYKKIINTGEKKFAGFSVCFDGGMENASKEITAEDITWNPGDEMGSSLEQYISKQGSSLKPDQRLLIKALYDREELGQTLENGFRGHPSIGALMVSSKFRYDLETKGGPWW
jgi:hypothetical protein